MIQPRIESPFTDGYATLHWEADTQAFRKEEYHYCYHYYACDETGERFLTPELADLNTVQIYNQYRAKHHILFPAQIKAMREQYELTAARMSLLLDLGPNQYRHYEDGEMPSASNANLLRLASDPATFRRLVEAHQFDLRPNEYQRLISRLEQLSLPVVTGYGKVAILPIAPALAEEPDEYTGFATPDFVKFAEMVLFFFQPLRHLGTVKLWKLMFYADFWHYRLTGSSISGFRYQALPHGPVPRQYEKYIGAMVDEQLLERVIDDTRVRTDGNGSVIWYAPVRPAKAELFTASEQVVLQEVLQKLGYKKRTEIEDLSHEEQAWLDNKANFDRISYQTYAYNLKAML
ncbi:MAG: type II TA system antitoxin MqsA family protein [Janthinobacterium lividum]